LHSITFGQIANAQIHPIEIKYSNSEPCRHYVSIGRIHSRRYDNSSAQSTATQKRQHPAFIHLPVVYSAHPFISTTLTFIKVRIFQRLTEDEFSVDVLDALREVDIGRSILPIGCLKLGTEDWDRSTTLDGESDVLRSVGEVWRKLMSMACFHIFGIVVNQLSPSHSK
jgi:hypothetical protein